MSNMQSFKRRMGRMPTRGAKFSQQAIKPYKAAPQAILMHYWHPDRTGVEHPPESVRTRLREIHPDLAMCRPPTRAPVRSNCWLVWYRKPTITHPLSPGWLLLFPWMAEDLTPLPIDDDRIYANIYSRSAITFGNAKKYFDHVVSEMRKPEDAKEAWHQDDKNQRRKSFWDFTKISTAGRGNKFALHHDGTLLPTRGERNWLNEISYRRMPEESRREYRDRRTGFNLTKRVSVDMGSAQLKGALAVEQRIFDTQLALARLLRERRAEAPVPRQQRKA